MPLQTDSVAVTGLGVVCSVGQTIDQLWQSLVSKKNGIREWDDLKALDFKYTHAHRIMEFDCDPLSRGYELAKKAISQALEQARLEEPPNAGLFLGTTMGESAAFEAIAEGNRHILQQDYNGNGICRCLRKHLPQVAMHRCYATACAAGNYSLKAAREALQSGRVDVAIAGGVDPFSKIAMTGFSRARAMSPSGNCRPFSPDRDGMVLGEGAGFLVLERIADAQQRQANILATLDACALSCDAYHPTAPRPDSAGIINCFEQLPVFKNGTKNAVDWICAHGTGTKLSDISEAQAIRRVFAEAPPLVSSIKAHIGHTLGAATAIEAVVSVLSIVHQQIPPTANSESSTLGVTIPTEVISRPVKKVLNCGYAFGGLNSISQFSQWN
ncbi:beta-ketoacyl-[acyl-carrier-protein] synthase family protein [Aggregatimonas sangjinii]|uniref:Beta-ketoacyl-[acyl-carrier-protein] synthase family protein n=1 Tax=Aggregatimonas sangjinii TaxID=2583587 RepID=A0A5B7SR21_9FLAO|nr:beta-ketoacyl-[acyl-carrier-protein] synthase family protein [Aggregatimonas sangjinii]QCX01017.1 beta-ketoacyl-[acyl-carrier-protein] synthase family protein [Aggregatimonas sangjinii]